MSLLTHARCWLAFALLCAFSPAALAIKPQAAAHARLGLEQFEAGEYDEAAASFAAASQAAPDDEHLRFNQACALAAQGNTAEARELWKQSALASDLKLAAESHYNLGCLALDEARGLFTADPLEASPEVRVQSLQHLAAAAEHYRDALAIDPQHAASQHNLELIRSWTTYMRTAWDDLDRKKRRDESDLFAFLDLLIESQRELRSTARREVGKFPSPRRWQVVYEAHKAQRTLTTEIEPLKEKITAALSANMETQPGMPGQGQAAQMLHAMADQAGRAMNEATAALEAQSPQEAVGPQFQAVESLESIYLSAAAFPELLRKAIAVEEKLVEQSKEIVASPDEHSPQKNQEQPAEEPLPTDFEDLAHRQRFVTELSTALPLKARALLAQIDPPPSERSSSGAFMDPGERKDLSEENSEPQENEKADNEEAEAPAADDKTPNAADEELLEPQALPVDEDDASKAEAIDTVEAQQQAALKKSLRKAIALAPEIERLTREASDDLQAEDAAHALPKQEEALRLLKEIAETLPPPESQQNQQQQNQDQPQDQQQNQDQQQQQQNENQQQENQSDRQQDQQSQEQQDDSQEPQDSPESKEPSEEQEGSQSEEPQQAEEPQQGDEDQPQPGEMQQEERQAMSEEQTTALLQRVRERQREHRERMRALERALRRAAPVEKDW